MKKPEEKGIGDLDLNSLVKLYEEAARLYGYYTEVGDYRKVNRQYGKITEIFREISSRGFDAQKEMLSLLNTDNLTVRLCVACHALRFSPEIGEKELSDIAANTRGVQSLDAEMTLREWKAGRLKFQEFEV
jgi:hypothetical protein